jgi:hypothetical protein
MYENVAPFGQEAETPLMQGTNCPLVGFTYATKPLGHDATTAAAVPRQQTLAKLAGMLLGLFVQT